MEVKRYKKQQTSAWSKNGLFSPRGQIEFDETFNDVNHRKFRIGVTEMQEHWSCSVKRIEDNKGPDHTVRIPKIPIRGSYFGSCTCGVDKRDAVPCEHMAVVAAGSRVKELLVKTSSHIGGQGAIGVSRYHSFHLKRKQLP